MARSMEGPGTAVRVTPSRRRADEWAVVLAAEDIPHWLRQRSDGMFYFQEFSETTDAVPVYGARSYTSPGFRSGLYKSAEAAEDDLRKMVPWLGGISK